MTTPAVLYVSYDGLLEPLGQSQVVAYLVPLARDHDVTVLSFEKPVDLADAEGVRALQARLRTANVSWIRLRYHKAPSLPATAFDIVHGATVGVAAARSARVGIVHARGYVPSAIAVWVKRLTRAKFLFDMRGFWPDEKVDAGHWTKASLAYRLTKRWERMFFAQADGIVSLTETGVRTFGLLGHPARRDIPVEVIPTCADLTRFCPGPVDAALAVRLGLASSLVIGYVGTLSNWYLREATLQYLARLCVSWPEAKVLFVTREDHERLRADAAAAGLAPDRMVLAAAAFEEMPAFVRLMRLGVFFIKPVPSKRGSAATKLAEFLGCGVPVVINDGVGDSGDLVRRHGVGVVLADVTRETMEASLVPVARLLGDSSAGARCVAAARAHFDLAVGVAKYSALYARLAAN